MKQIYMLIALVSSLVLSAQVHADSSRLVKLAAPGDFSSWSSVKLMPKYCKKYELDVEVTQVDLKVLPQITIAQNRGDFDVVGVLMIPFLKTVANGNNAHIFANLSSGGIALVTRVDSNISNIANLKGKRILVGRGSAAELITKVRLAQEGLSYSTEPGAADVTLVQVLNTQAETLFVQGQGDAAALSFPEATKILDNKIAKVVTDYVETNRVIVVRNDFPADKEKKLAACMKDIYRVLTSPARTAQQNADIMEAGVKMPDPNRKEQYQWNLVIHDAYLNDIVALLKKDNELPANFKLPANFNQSTVFKK